MSLSAADALADDDALRCSAKACRAPAEVDLQWRNPSLHDAGRVKHWLACRAHEQHLADFLARRGFLLGRAACAHPPMSPDPRLAAATDLLRALGADRIDHPGGTLLDHVVRVRIQLEEWSAPAEVQLAGLCHACYGTDGFEARLLDTSRRSELAAVIGHEAEAFVYLYASCDRALTYPRLGDDVVGVADRFTGRDVTPPAAALRAFAEITAANEVDIVRHNAGFAEHHSGGLAILVDRMARHLSVGALRTWRDPAIR